MEDSETMSLFDEAKLLEVERKAWTVECKTSLNPAEMAVIDCAFTSQEPNPILESFVMIKNSPDLFCNEHANAEQGFCNELPYRLAKHCDIPIRYRNSSKQGEIRELTEIAEDIRSFIVSETQIFNDTTNALECIKSGKHQNCVYEDKMLKTRGGLNWEEHKYFIGVGLIMLFVSGFLGFLALKLVKKRRRADEAPDINSEDSLLTSITPNDDDLIPPVSNTKKHWLYGITAFFLISYQLDTLWTVVLQTAVLIIGAQIITLIF